ncbi:MAG: hypothetical protein U0359_14440 [Byssovorax sp.]
MVMNASLSFADWHKLRNLDGGMYGIHNGDPNQPENPAETMSVPRIVTLTAGQPLFRWVDSKAGGSMHQKAAGSWWSTKRIAQQILARARAGGTADTSESARHFSNVARAWGSDLREVVHIMVLQPVKAFLGVGRDVWDAQHREKWDSLGLQLYIPQMVETKNGVRTLSHIAKHHFQVMWVKSSDEFDAWALEQAMRRGSRIAGG